MNAIAYAVQLLSVLPSLVQAGKDIQSTIAMGTARLSSMQAEQRDPTQNDWDELNLHIRTLRGELHEGETGAPDFAPAAPRVDSVLGDAAHPNSDS